MRLRQHNRHMMSEQILAGDSIANARTMHAPARSPCAAHARASPPAKAIIIGKGVRGKDGIHTLEIPACGMPATICNAITHVAHAQCAHGRANNRTLPTILQERERMK